MTTNRDWLFSLPLEEQYAWMNAEHQDSTLDGDTEPENEDSREQIEADVHNFAEKSGWLYPMAGTRIVLEWLDRQAAITEREYGERMASEAMCSNVCAVVCEQRGRIAELQVKVDELKELNEYNALQYELASEDADEKWNLYVEEHGIADSNAADREMYRKTTTVLMDCITEGLRKVNAVLDGKDEGLA